jgi:hypothetical protein
MSPSRRNFLIGSAGAGALAANAQPGLVRAAPPKQQLGLPIGPLSLDQMTRDTWGIFDPLVIAKLGPAANEDCYQHKWYKSPLTPQEVLPPFGFVTQTLRLTPGSLLYGVYCPAINPVTAFAGPAWNIQITDKSGTEDYNLFDQPIPAFFLSNLRLTFQGTSMNPAGPLFGSFPYLFADPYPITGNGLLMVQIWETSGATQRVECVLGVLERVL